MTHAADAKVAVAKSVAHADTAYLPTLDGWRAIAVGLVIFSHNVGRDSRFREAGGLGVSIFFGISGFLICTRLLEEIKRSGGISLRTFYVRRAFRILPPAFAYLIAACFFALLGIFKMSGLEVFASAFFFRNYVPGSWHTSHFWSLAVEEHFYLFFPALLAAIGPRRMRWAALLISFGVAAWRIVDSRTGLLTSHLPDGVYPAARTDFRLDGLMLGCFAALVLFSRPRMPPWLPGLVAALAAPLLFVDMLEIIHLPAIVQAAVIVAMLAGTVLAGADNPLGRLLELPAMRWVGRLSYSLYLWQQLFCVKYAVDRTPELRLVQTAPWSIVALFAVCTVSYYALERPMIKVGHRLVKSVVPSRL